MKTLYYHTAAWCEPCKRIKPVARRIAERMGVEFVEIDVDRDQPMLPDVMGVPTIAVVEDGELVATLAPSMISPETIRKALS